MLSRRTAHCRSVAGRQTDGFLRSPEGAVALDVPQYRPDAVAGRLRDRRYMAIVLVAHVGQRARVVTRTIHVAVQVLLQVPVVAQVPDHDAAGAAREIEKVGEAAPPARGEHCEELRVLQHQLGRAVLVYVEALGVGRPVALHRPARGACDHDRAARMAGERCGEPGQAGPALLAPGRIGLVPRGLVGAVEVVLPSEVE